MLFYVSTNETVEDDNGEKRLPISDLYDYHIVEIREFPNAYTAEVDRIIRPDQPDTFPEGVNYIRPEGDAKALVYDELNLDRYDHNPAWIVLETTPDRPVDKFIMFELDNMENPEKAGEVLRRIYSSLGRDEFDRLDWEERRLWLEEQMSDLMSAAGLVISLVT